MRSFFCSVYYEDYRKLPLSKWLRIKALYRIRGTEASGKIDGNSTIDQRMFVFVHVYLQSICIGSEISDTRYFENLNSFVNLKL